jgi:hypothetical protein
VILRRGPAAWYHLILWHTDQDRFEHGAWFKGRLYEDRCDLSPDGELFLYFALQSSRFATAYKGAWTAVSRPPWLHALTLWPQGHTWGGGGRFVGKREAVLFTCDLKAHPDHPLEGLAVSAGSPASCDPVVDFRSKEWSGRDHAGRLVYTSCGRLYRRRRGEDVLVADFNGLEPAPQPAPAWAQTSLPPLPSADRRPKRHPKGGRRAATRARRHGG